MERISGLRFVSFVVREDEEISNSLVPGSTFLTLPDPLDHHHRTSMCLQPCFHDITPYHSSGYREIKRANVSGSIHYYIIYFGP